MKNILKVTLLLILSGFLVACTSPKDEDNNLNDNQTPTEQPGDNQDADENQNNNEDVLQDKVMLENEAFKIFEPTPNSEISDNFTVRGLASVFEGNVNYEFEDGHYIMDEGSVTATQGAPEWGEFEFTVKIDDAVTGSASIVLFESSAKDGSRINELIIPIKINADQNDNDDVAQDKVMLENEAFKIFEPSPDSEISDDFTVRGLASVFEGNVNYEFEDGHYVMDEGFVTATQGGPEWGEFEFTIKIDDAVTGSASIVLFELSAKDGSRINELIIPIIIKK